MPDKLSLKKLLNVNRKFNIIFKSALKMDDYLGSINIFAFGFAPNGYAVCNGQLLQISQYQALFSILGITYGGNGITNFGLPDFRGKIPVSFNNSNPMGQSSGTESIVLDAVQIPQHNHPLSGGTVSAKAGSGNANSISPEGNFYATNPGLTGRFSNQPDTLMYNNAPFETNSIGSTQAHENRMPFLVLNFCICVQGLFPSRS